MFVFSKETCMIPKNVFRILSKNENVIFSQKKTENICTARKIYLYIYYFIVFCLVILKYLFGSYKSL